MVPTKIVTRLDPVVTAPELLEENVTDSEESVDHAFEGMSYPGHYYQSGKRDDFLDLRQLEGTFGTLLVLGIFAISKGPNLFVERMDCRHIGRKTSLLGRMRYVVVIRG
jgi:hypothetical protein